MPVAGDTRNGVYSRDVETQSRTRWTHTVQYMSVTKAGLLREVVTPCLWSLTWHVTRFLRVACNFLLFHLMSELSMSLSWNSQGKSPKKWRVNSSNVSKCFLPLLRLIVCPFLVITGEAETNKVTKRVCTEHVSTKWMPSLIAHLSYTWWAQIKLSSFVDAHLNGSASQHAVQMWRGAPTCGLTGMSLDNSWK